MHARTPISLTGPSAVLVRAVALVLATLLLGSAGAQDPLRIAHATWSSSRASAHVVAEALRAHLDVPVELREMAIDEAWSAVASGDADVLLSAWLPDTHAPYLERYGDDLVDLGPNLEGTRTGLAVPDVGSSRQTGPGGARGAGADAVRGIADLRDRADRYGGVIIGIDDEAGVMRQARDALDRYGLEGWEVLVTGSESAMLERLSDAVRLGRPIVVTGWVPLWANARWNLRFLDDPEGAFGDDGAIHTMVRDGLPDERPDVVAALDAFSWTPEAMERVMIWMEEPGVLPRDAARRWLDANPGVVRGWFE